MSPDPAASDHPAQRWISAAFGSVDPFALMDEACQARGWQPDRGLDGRTATEERVFIVLNVALERHSVAVQIVDRLARDVVRVVASTSPEVAHTAIKSLMER